MSGKTPEQLITEGKAALAKQVVRLQDELDAMIKMAAFQRKALENEMMGGLGYKQLSADPKVLGKFKVLSESAGKLTDAKIRLDKSLKQMAETMTPEEEREAVGQYIKALPAKERINFLMGLVEWHRRKSEASMIERGLEVHDVSGD